MRRRTFLALAATGLATGTAGCAGIGNDGNDGADGSDGTGGSDTSADARTTDAAETTTAPTMNAETTTMTGQRTATVVGTTGGNSSDDGGSGVSGQVTSVPDGLKITKQWFYRKQFSTGVRGVIKNVSGSPFEYVEIRATFYTAGGKRLDTSIDHVTNLAAGEEWPFEVLYRGSRDPSRIVRYTLTVDTSPF